MEDPPEETEPPYHPLPHSQREIHSVALLLDLACSDTERKQILAPYGLTVEGFDELFGHHLGSTGTGDG